MSEQYFLVRKLGLGKEVASHSLVVTEVSRGGQHNRQRFMSHGNSNN